MLNDTSTDAQWCTLAEKYEFYGLISSLRSKYVEKKVSSGSLISILREGRASSLNFMQYVYSTNRNFTNKYLKIFRVRIN